MPSTPLGFVYPDSSDHTRTWEHWQALAESVDDFLSDRYCILTSDVSQTIPDNVGTIVNLDRVEVDPHGWGDVATNRITIDRAGLYVFTGYLVYGNNGTGFVTGSIVNGTGVDDNVVASDYNSASNWRTTVQPRTRPLFCSPGDTFIFVVHMNTQGDIPSNVSYGGTYFMCERVQ